jgi:hypothetical protein
MTSNDTIPYVLADTAPAEVITHPQASRGFAILLPDGRLWREPIRYAIDPHDGTPDIWPTRAKAIEAKNDIVKMVVGTYGARDYKPAVVQVELADLGATVHVLAIEAGAEVEL